MGPDWTAQVASITSASCQFYCYIKRVAFGGPSRLMHHHHPRRPQPRDRARDGMLGLLDQGIPLHLSRTNMRKLGETDACVGIILRHCHRGGRRTRAPPGSVTAPVHNVKCYTAVTRYSMTAALIRSPNPHLLHRQGPLTNQHRPIVCSLRCSPEYGST